MSTSAGRRSVPKMEPRNSVCSGCHVIWLRRARLPRQAAVSRKGTARGARGTRGGADGLSGSATITEAHCHKLIGSNNKAVAREETARPASAMRVHVRNWCDPETSLLRQLQTQRVGVIAPHPLSHWRQGLWTHAPTSVPNSGGRAVEGGASGQPRELRTHGARCASACQRPSLSLFPETGRWLSTARRHAPHIQHDALVESATQVVSVRVLARRQPRNSICQSS